jgi:hypothetical protein
MTGANVCGVQAVYATPHERTFIGYIISRELARDGDTLVPIIDLKVRIEGHALSVWRRESDVLRWYFSSRCNPTDLLYGIWGGAAARVPPERSRDWY